MADYTMTFNIAEYLDQAAARYESKTALYDPLIRGSDGLFHYRTLSFRELSDLSKAYAQAFYESGIIQGTRVLLLMKPGLEFAAAVFAIYRIGAAPVIIDPGMGLRNMRRCIEQTTPEAMIAVSQVHWFRKFSPTCFKSVKIAWGIGMLLPPGVKNISAVKIQPEIDFPPVATRLDDMAAIVFTTGSTGPPKGVVYTHKIFKSQIANIREVYQAGPDYVDMSAFPLFALFAVITGMPSIIPKMDFTRPAKVNPENIIREINTHKVSFSFGSPALWRTVADYAIAHNLRMPGLKKVLMAGAPVLDDLHSKVLRVIAEDGDTWVPYGATESLTTATFTGREMIRETAAATRQGQGYCVGYINPGMTVKVIKVIDGPINQWNDSLELPPNERGEIVVRGDVVKAAYFNNPKATSESEIPDPDGKWHRIGDIGYFDTQGRLWFCGRVTHRVFADNMIYYPVCSEAVFNAHPQVFRTALVQGPNQTTVLFVEPIPGSFPNSKHKKQLISELLELGKQYPFTNLITDIRFVSKFPVDIRHNAKIFREKLSAKVMKRKEKRGKRKGGKMEN